MSKAAFPLLWQSQAAATEAVWTTESKRGCLGKFAHLWISLRCAGLKHRFETIWALVIDREAWRAAILRVAKSRTLSD